MSDREPETARVGASSPTESPARPVEAQRQHEAQAARIILAGSNVDALGSTPREGDSEHFEHFELGGTSERSTKSSSATVPQPNSEHSEYSEHRVPGASHPIPLLRADIEDVEHWEQPIDLDAADRPEFPVDLLPASLAGWSRAISTSIQVPVDMAAMAALATVAVAVQKHFRVSVNKDWVEQLSAFVAIIAEPSERKSPVFRQAMKPILAFERDENRRREPLIRASQEKAADAEAAITSAMNNLKRKLNTAEKEAESARLQQARDALAELKPVRPLSLFADDATTEAIEKALFEQGGRYAVMSSEGGLFQILGGRYADAGKGGNIDIYLKGISGDPHRSVRITRAGGQIECTTLSVLVFVQPGAMRDAATNRAFTERGLFARMWLVTPRSMVGHRRSDPPEIPDRVTTAWNTTLRKLLEIVPAQDEFGEIRPMDLLISPNATAVLRRTQDQLEPRLGRGGDLSAPEIASWAGKLIGSIARIAGLLQLIDIASRKEGELDPAVDIQSTSIAEGWMEAAVRIGIEYLLPHCLFAMQAMRMSPGLCLAEQILAFLRCEQRRSITSRDLRQAHRSRITSTEHFEEALRILEDHHAIRRSEQARSASGRGRKPSVIIQVNPLLLDAEAGAHADSGAADLPPPPLLKMLRTLEMGTADPTLHQERDQTTRTTGSSLSASVQTERPETATAAPESAMKPEPEPHGEAFSSDACPSEPSQLSGLHLADPADPIAAGIEQFAAEAGEVAL